MRQQTFTFDDFKEMAKSNEFIDKFTNNNRHDLIDFDNGVMRIYSENLNKYLEQYSCKDAEDLEDTLYYSYGIYCEVID